VSAPGASVPPANEITPYSSAVTFAAVLWKAMVHGCAALAHTPL